MELKPVGEELYQRGLECWAAGGKLSGRRIPIHKKAGCRSKLKGERQWRRPTSRSKKIRNSLKLDVQ
jgi:hypothetical protein